MSIRRTVSVLLLLSFIPFLIFICLTVVDWAWGKVFYYYLVLVTLAFLKKFFVVVLSFGFCFLNILQHSGLTRSVCVFLNWSLGSAPLVWLNTFTLNIWDSQVAQWQRICLPSRRHRRRGWERSGRSPGEDNGNPLQYPALGNPTDRRGGGLQSMGSQSGTWLND